jgi:hypothetical protein
MPGGGHAYVHRHQQRKTKRVQDSFVLLMRELEGFRGYYLLDGGLDVIITSSLFESVAEALVSNENAPTG